MTNSGALVTRPPPSFRSVNDGFENIADAGHFGDRIGIAPSGTIMKQAQTSLSKEGKVQAALAQAPETIILLRQAMGLHKNSGAEKTL